MSASTIGTTQHAPLSTEGSWEKSAHISTCRMKIDMGFDLATWLRLVKVMELDINKF